MLNEDQRKAREARGKPRGREDQLEVAKLVQDSYLRFHCSSNFFLWFICSML